MCHRPAQQGDIPVQHSSLWCSAPTNTSKAGGTVVLHSVSTKKESQNCFWCISARGDSRLGYNWNRADDGKKNPKTKTTQQPPKRHTETQSLWFPISVTEVKGTIEQSHSITTNRFNCRLSLCSVSSGKDLESRVPASLHLQDTNWKHLSDEQSKASPRRAARSLLKYECKTCHFLQHRVMNENVMVIKSDSSVWKKTKFLLSLKPLSSSPSLSPSAEDSAAEATPTCRAGLHPLTARQGWVRVFV